MSQHRALPAAPPSAPEHREGAWAIGFTAMGCPCEVLVDTDDPERAEVVASVARDEALRIERKFSRYRGDNIVHRIHSAGGAPVAVDDETAALIDYAATCHDMSSGAFDITTGALRRVWTFDGREAAPTDAAIAAALAHVGWQRVTWRDHVLTLPHGMEIDFGGIGKEYAVDRAAALVADDGSGPAALVNFGGDLVATRERREGRPWTIGIEDPARPGEAAAYKVELLSGGALATSGDARRFVTSGGKRLGHILDPRTGWPVMGAPRSVTVLASTCLEAGTLTTLACLAGERAREFLEAQGVRHWIL